MKILITEFMEVKCVEVLKINFDVTVDHDLSANSNELKKIISKFDALIVRNKTQVNKAVLEKATNLKFIGRLGVGLDNIDTDYCKSNNIYGLNYYLLKGGTNRIIEHGDIVNNNRR